VNGPLTGCRVLELGSTVAGPFCGRLLADFGAEVIKNEALAGDPVRSMGKAYKGQSLYAASIFRNKRLVAVDLNRPEGREIIRELALASDVVIENFRPGTLERWGLDYESLANHHPKLIMVRISGYGQTGPYRNRPGYGIIGETFGGLRFLNGFADRPPPRAGVSTTDYLAGLYGAFGALLALIERERSGHGQVVDASLYEAAFSLMEVHVPAYEKLGDIPSRSGFKLPGSAPNTLYEANDGEYLHIAAPGDAVFSRLVYAMDKPELETDARFATARLRAENAEELDEVIGEWTRSISAEDVEGILVERGVPVSRIMTLKDIFEDEQYRARGSLQTTKTANGESITLAGIVPRLSTTPGAIRHAGRKIGADTRWALETIGGRTGQEVTSLERRGVISCGGDDAR
jgi:crotonobetainyl-CoA:carnitine CoA-transferase CaiB-like acyl-CoA transferase